MTDRRIEGLIVGQLLLGVQYDLLPWEEVPDHTSTMDAVGRAVLLRFSGLDVAFKWRLRPPIERLELIEHGFLDPGPLTQRVDVSDRWSSILGRTVTDAHWAFQETDGGVQPWACRLDFSGDVSLVVALGEKVEGRPTYIPDSLLVTGRRQAAEAYQPAAAGTTAWTDQVG